MIITQETGYLDNQYLENDYLLATARAIFGLQFTSVVNVEQVKGIQFTSVVNDDLSKGVQFLNVINKDYPSGMQFNSIINEAKHAKGVQFNGVINEASQAKGLQFTISINNVTVFGLQFSNLITKDIAKGLQFKAIINEAFNTKGIQFNSNINNAYATKGLQYTATVNNLKTYGVQFNSFNGENVGKGTQFFINQTQPESQGLQFSIVPHFHATGYYLTDSYLSDYYLDPQGMVRCHIPLQFRAVGLTYKPSALQFSNTINTLKPQALQFRGVVDNIVSKGMQFNIQKNELKSTGVQFSNTINKLNFNGVQFTGVVNKLTSSGLQFTNVTLGGLSAQFRVALYNNYNLRVLFEFPSRGNGTNWTTNSVAVGDFDINNVNTDTVEQVWRSATGSKTGINLVCDTGLNQGAYIDTLAILNHNLTKNASVTVVGSATPDFATIIETIIITTETENSFYISPELPLTSARYWKFIIDDATNSNSYLQIGTIVFGSAVILHGENYSNPLKIKRTNYADGVQTEGFTYVKNDRSIKKSIDIDFRSLNFNGGNYKNLQEIFTTARTTLKSLWIPAPKYASRYAVFGKLTDLPQEEHIDNAEDATYVTLSLTVDESQ